MKALEQMSLTEKAEMLYHLFPAAIPDLVDFIGNMAQVIEEDQHRNRMGWLDSRMPFEQWLQLARATAERISREEQEIKASAASFAAALFSEPYGTFTVHALLVYILTIKQPNSRLAVAIHLFFKD